MHPPTAMRSLLPNPSDLAVTAAFVSIRCQIPTWLALGRTGEAPGGWQAATDAQPELPTGVPDLLIVSSANHNGIWQERGTAEASVHA